MPLSRHAGLEEPALACPVLDTGYLIRGHPDVVPTKVGNHFIDWLPVFTENTGFRLELIPMKIGAGMTPFYCNFGFMSGLSLNGLRS